MSTVSERIKKIRLTAAEKKLSREEFAARLGVSSSVVNNWENAENRLKNEIPEYALKHICEVYGVHYQWLVEGIEPMMEIQEPDMDTLIDQTMINESELTKSIMKAFAKLPDSEWTKLKNLIDRIDKAKAEGR